MTIKVGLVGAGWWAHDVHAPLHMSGEGTELVGVWARDSRKAADFAAEFGIRAFESFAELLSCCDAVDFAVPPHVQALMAVEAARAGKALILEKPIAGDLETALQLVEAIEAHNTPHIVCFTRRYNHETVDFLDDVAALAVNGNILGMQGHYVHGGLLEGGILPPSGTWRHDFHGILMDLGPHAMNLAAAALGKVTKVRAQSGRFITITAEHESGVCSQIALSGSVDVDSDHFQETVFADSGIAHFDVNGQNHAECWENIRSEFIGAVNDGTPVTVDAREALHLQAILEAARDSHDSGVTEIVAQY
ncbi:putative dehydrogenase [Arcanobacterium pluranimalium]|uniref:Gfo/Idh/MocA family protein n=1 Tax=Arcanobacterium pluranimalium TaxID=108028 RepID=UPI00195BEF66|nr:Gfo/Idh/MocA family oxidoreductase [Arcanobacterium pluranimalium]MBM7824754.1 putative dehydrogenase [Arcanobacterium pluranimalium]